MYGIFGLRYTVVSVLSIAPKDQN
uniref:Uncharacterized protein n=1 Tax=Arundo donax TaxID=35708 RepID=A0A0A9GZY6_ARUDO